MGSLQIVSLVEDKLEDKVDETDTAAKLVGNLDLTLRQQSLPDELTFEELAVESNDDDTELELETTAATWYMFKRLLPPQYSREFA